MFDDPYAITIVDDESDPTEQRFITLGMGAAGRLLAVAYAWRGRTFELSLHVPPRITNGRNMRQIDEG